MSPTITVAYPTRSAAALQDRANVLCCDVQVVMWLGAAVSALAATRACLQWEPLVVPPMPGQPPTPPLPPMASVNLTTVSITAECTVCILAALSWESGQINGAQTSLVALCLALDGVSTNRTADFVLCLHIGLCYDDAMHF